MFSATKQSGKKNEEAGTSGVSRRLTFPMEASDKQPPVIPSEYSVISPNKRYSSTEDYIDYLCYKGANLLASYHFNTFQELRKKLPKEKRSSEL